MKIIPEVQTKTIADLANRCEGPDQFERFDRAFRASLTISKHALLKKEARQKRDRAKRRVAKKRS